MPQVSRTQRLIVVLVLNLGLVAALVIVGITAHSLAVLAEGGDYLLDAAGVAVALLAIRLSARPASRARQAPTDVAALVNCGWLLALEILIIGAAAERLLTRTPQVHGLPVLIVSGVAALTMTAGASSSKPTQTTTTMTLTGATFPSPRYSSIPSPTPPRRQAWPSPAGSSWPPAAGTGSTPRWRSSSPWSSPTTPWRCSAKSSSGSAQRHDLDRLSLRLAWVV